MGMKHRKNIVQEVLGEQCIYGGLLATRMEVYQDLVEIHKARGQKINHLFIDRLTWMPKAATPDQVEFLSERGMTLKRMREWEAREDMKVAA